MNEKLEKINNIEYIDICKIENYKYKFSENLKLVIIIYKQKKFKLILNFFKFNLKNLKFYLINFIFKYTKFYSKYFFIKQILGKIIKDNRAQAYE